MAEAQRNTTVMSTGWDERAAADWVAQDERGDEISLPWRLACIIVGNDRPSTTSVLDVASGPGGFLEAVLRYFPTAHGVWFDFSDTMRAKAEDNLSLLRDRVEFRLGDMVSLNAAGPAASFDLVTTSRATHHLTVFDLGRFYSQAAERLVPGGWVVNLDLLNAGEPWSSRLSEARSTLRGPRPRKLSNHPHLVPAPSMEDHLACMRAAGLELPLVVWRSLTLGLMMARKPDPS